MTLMYKITFYCMGILREKIISIKKLKKNLKIFCNKNIFRAIKLINEIRNEYCKKLNLINLNKK